MAQSTIRVDWKFASGKDISSRLFSSKKAAEGYADSLRNVFAEQGYLRIERSENYRSDTLFILIDSGIQHVWGEIDQGNVPDILWKRLVKPGREFSEPYLWMENLIRLSEDSGYPFASVGIDSLIIDGEHLYGKFQFKEGPEIIWDSLSVSGETSTSKKFLQLYSGLVPGKPFSQTQFEGAVRKMSRSPYFRLDSIPQVTFQIKKASPHFSLSDRKINVFDGIIGLIPNQNQASSMLITGQLNLDLFHLGGKGRDVSIHWLRPNIQSQNLELGMKESYLFGSPLSLQVDFLLLKQDSSFVNREVKLEFDYAFSEAGILRFFGKRKAGDVIEVGELIDVSPSLLDYRWNNYGFGAEWNKLDNPVFPRKGYKVDGEFSVGNKRLLNNTSIPMQVYEELEISSTQFQGTINLEKHTFINSYWGMWLRIKTGFLGNENLLLNELSRLGGLKSIRGFNEMFFFADRFSFLNMEQRFYFGEESFLMLFGDLGWVNNPYLNPKIDRPRSIGLGMNLDTDGGLFSFVLGLGKSNYQPLSFSFARIHFGYLARF